MKVRRVSILVLVIIVVLGVGLVSAGQDKVTICHNGNTITVGRPAVDTHVGEDGHGDSLGSCPDTTPAPTNPVPEPEPAPSQEPLPIPESTPVATSEPIDPPIFSEPEPVDQSVFTEPVESECASCCQLDDSEVTLNLARARLFNVIADRIEAGDELPSIEIAVQ